ncbi:hypothetical protein [Oceanobacillus halophilus]|uniref:Uncharacterized protein n=1 Tax=Oceanobacillus halophilus TaxID=930130 RepID=A0A495A3W6_9BACI|nr:hypothetical protein [Oceanobacillus halophilus]RKQ34246.1 hypothetical protein D8M06_07620 [Oceanobacillus halophilus]
MIEWQMPPDGGMYKLVGTRKVPNDISLIVLIDDDKEDTLHRREYSWRNVPNLHNEGLKQYLLSMSDGIERGFYDIALIDEELGELPEDWEKENFYVVREVKKP